MVLSFLYSFTPPRIHLLYNITPGAAALKKDIVCVWWGGSGRGLCTFRTQSCHLEPGSFSRGFLPCEGSRGTTAWAGTLQSSY